MYQFEYNIEKVQIKKKNFNVLNSNPSFKDHLI